MSEKIKIIHKPFSVIESAVNKAVNLIKPTYGPSGNKVIISKILNKMVVDDGVQIARDLEFSDEAENAIWDTAKGTAIRTNDRVGDGTTGALIMLQAIINEVGKLTRWEGRKIEKQLKAGLLEAKKQLLAMAKPVKTLQDLQKVARISFDDENVANIIADAWYKLGKDGVVTVDKSGTMETFSDISDGIKINNGYISPYMINNPDRMEAVIEKPYILLTDYRLTEAADVISIMNALASKQISNLVIIAENVEGTALGTLIINKLQGKFNAVAVNSPLSGNERTNFLEDLGIMTGARVFSSSKGDKLEEAKIEDLGRAERFIARRDNSVIINPKGDKATINKAVSDLNKAIENALKEIDKDRLRERLARLVNKVAIIKVGATTEQEERALRYKVDDAVHATKAAFNSGVVPGGGIALSSIKTSSEILNEALKQPFRQLCNNVGLENIPKIPKGQAINVVTDKIGNFFEVGVMDPVDVLIAGIESAVSIASLLLTSSGMIVEKPKEIKQE